MRSLSATETARRLSDVLDAVEGGETFLIVRHGHVVARLAPAVDGIGKSVKDTLLRSPRDAGWLEDVRATRAAAVAEDRSWTG